LLPATLRSNTADKGGTVAWQVAARYDAIDLNDSDAGLTGGETGGHNRSELVCITKHVLHGGFLPGT
jgi:phosphate-selective porin